MKKLTFICLVLVAFILGSVACSDQDAVKDRIRQKETRESVRELVMEQNDSDYFFFEDELKGLSKWKTCGKISTTSMPSSLKVEWRYVTPISGSHKNVVFVQDVRYGFQAGDKKITFTKSNGKILKRGMVADRSNRV